MCPICNGSESPFGTLIVMSKFNVSYFRCTNCGFIHTEQPYWLERAYSEAIASQDVGVITRNEMNAVFTSSLLSLAFRNTSHALDFGGGHGVFVRMMRDRGFNFFWKDLYASNHFARGFEFDPKISYDFVTAFEVLEHFVEPMRELESIMDIADNVFVSTLTVPTPTPQLSDSWYYLPSTGQHLSFYTKETLLHIAAHYQRPCSRNALSVLFGSD
jgi:2-polyprenyl-3-methyl-5-hydroxy-6-metoxy-1,4-benzoquinol methylase